MNIQQFLSEQPIDKLVHQYFALLSSSLSTSSATNAQTAKQQSLILQSILIYIGQHTEYGLKELFKECQYQLEVHSQERQAIVKAVTLLASILDKASFLMRSSSIEQTTLTILEFLMEKVFLTVCSASCIRCIRIIVNTFWQKHPVTIVPNTKNQTSQKLNCCNQNQSQQQNNHSHQQENYLKSHQKIITLLLNKFLLTHKLHIKAYPFRTRKQIYQILKYVLFVITQGQKVLKSIILGKCEGSKCKNTNTNSKTCCKSKSQNENFNVQSQDKCCGNFIQDKCQQQSCINLNVGCTKLSTLQPILMNVPITQQKLIDLIIKSFQDQKDPRNIKIVFQCYQELINNFSHEIQLFQYKAQLFENISAYYPLSMEGDQTDIKINSQDAFSQSQLVELLDKCLLEPIFAEQVRQMLIEKMLSPPIHQYVSLYVKYINRFNPFLQLKDKQTQNTEQFQKYSILTMNLLQRLCEQEYLQEAYFDQNDQTDNTKSQHQPRSQSQFQYTLPTLITSILKNTFVKSSQCSFSLISPFFTYNHSIETKYVSFLSELITNKLFNTEENNKFAGTTIEIVKEILSCASSSSPSSQIISMAYSQRMINFQQILIQFVIFKFMQYWTGKGDIAFKLGLLIMVLNKKLASLKVYKDYESNSKNQQEQQHKLQLLLITLGNVYEKYNETDQVKIMVLKCIMILCEIFKKQCGLIRRQYTQEDSHSNKIKFKVQKISTQINKIRILNNNIIFNDCIGVSKALACRSLQKQNGKQQNQTKSKISQDPLILKCYVDYIFMIYMHNYSETCNNDQNITEMFNNILSFGICPNTFSIQQNDESHKQNSFLRLQQTLSQTTKGRYFQVKLYAVVRYLSSQIDQHQCFNLSYLEKNQNTLSVKPSIVNNNELFEMLFLIFMISTNMPTLVEGKHINDKDTQSLPQLDFKQTSMNKLINILSPYSFKVIVGILTEVFKSFYYQASAEHEENNFLFKTFKNTLLNKSQYFNFILNNFCNNLSRLSVLVCKKFAEFSENQAESEKTQQISIILFLESHIMAFKENNNNLKCEKGQTDKKYYQQFIQVTLWYLFKRSWKKFELIEQKESKLFSSFSKLVKGIQQKQQNTDKKSITNLITSHLAERINSIIQIHEKSDNFSQMQVSSPLQQSKSIRFKELQTSLLYVKLLKTHQIEQSLMFKRYLSDLYEPGMIEYFWNREMSKGRKQIKSPVKQQNLQHNLKCAVQTDKQRIVQLIQFIPEKSLAKNAESVLPIIIYRHQSLKLSQESSIKSQNKIFDFNRVKILSQIVKNLPETSLCIYILPFCLQFLQIVGVDGDKSNQVAVDQVLLNNKILFGLNQLIEQKPKQYPQLKSKIQAQKKLIMEQLTKRQIYHKKRVIRQSARCLINSIQ